MHTLEGGAKINCRVSFDREQPSLKFCRGAGSRTRHLWRACSPPAPRSVRVTCQCDRTSLSRAISLFRRRTSLFLSRSLALHLRVPRCFPRQAPRTVAWPKSSCPSRDDDSENERALSACREYRTETCSRVCGKSARTGSNTGLTTRCESKRHQAVIAAVRRPSSELNLLFRRTQDSKIGAIREVGTTPPYLN